MEQEALAFIQALQGLYLEQRDIENVLTAIDQQTSWIGTGSKEICKSFTEAAGALLSEQTECAGGFTITDSWYETRLLPSDACLVYGEFWAKPKEDSLEMAELHHRVSAVCAKGAQGMKLLHLHMSQPDDDQEDGKYFVKNSTRTSHQSLRLKFQQASDDLQERNRELEILTENIPGGVHRCKNDPYFTLMNMSGGFLKLFGYSEEDIATLFRGSFMNMIYEGDRASVAAITKEQLAVGPTVEYEYRVRCKNGALMWVLDRGKLVAEADGSESFFCMMMDITLRKEEQEKLRLTLERHNVIMDQATDIIFEWDILQDTIDFSSNWEKKFGYLPISQEISQKIPLSENIHPDDMPAFIKIMKDTALGIPYSETEFRIRSISTAYTWCRIRATTQFDSDCHPIKAVGVIVDIDDEKNRSNILLEQTQRDPLTNLYNKTATRTKIDNILNDKNNGMLHTLMIIDVDNFKSVNDRFGHQCGDTVLSNMAHALKKIFRATDIIGRIGGDEFLVLMTNITNESLAAKKAKQIVQIFCEMPLGFESDLSCSVGMALYPRDGATYMGLARCADNALYRVKNNGKADFAFYHDSMRKDPPYSMIRTAINEKNDVYDHTLNGELIQYAFRMLYNAVDIKIAITEILKKIGQAYDVSRVYVFETSDDGLFCSNTFEWCNEGVAPKINLLQNLSFETDLLGFFDIYDENGVFYCQDITTLSSNLCTVLEAQGVVSVLQCFIQDNGCFKGYIGFDECRGNRHWTKEQVDTLTSIANVLSTFLIKLRLQEELKNLKKIQGKDGLSVL